MHIDLQSKPSFAIRRWSCVVVVFAMMVTAGNAQWSLIQVPTLYYPNYGAIAVRGVMDVLAVGSEGGRQFVIKSDDGGESFHRAYTGPTNSGASGKLKSIAYGEGGIVFSTGGSSCIYSVDSGRSWMELKTLLPDSIIPRIVVCTWHSVVVGANSDVVLSGQNIQGSPVMLRGSLNTLVWELGDALTYYSRIQYLGGDVYRATEDGGRYVYESMDVCATWTKKWRNDNFIHDVWFIDSLNGWAAALDGAWRTSDGGQQWIKAIGETRCSTICFVDTANGWMLDDSFLGHSTDGGRTYVDQSTDVESYYNGGRILAVASPLTAYFSDGRRVYRTTNGGGLASSLNDEMDGQSPSIDEIVIHPNPSDEWCELSLRPGIVDHIQLCDDTGRLVRSVVVTDRNTYTLNTADLPSGVYRVIVRGEHTTGSTCLVIVH